MEYKGWTTRIWRGILYFLGFQRRKHPPPQLRVEYSHTKICYRWVHFGENFGDGPGAKRPNEQTQNTQERLFPQWIYHKRGSTEQ